MWDSKDSATQTSATQWSEIPDEAAQQDAKPSHGARRKPATRAAERPIPQLHHRSFSEVLITQSSPRGPGSHSSNVDRTYIAAWSRSTPSERTMADTPQRTVDGITAVSSSGPVEDVDDESRWAAFLAKHEHVIAMRIQAGDLRRQCLALRLALRGSEPQAHLESTTSDTDDNEDDFFDVAATRQNLEQIEKRLNELDEALINDEGEMYEAAPKVLKRIKQVLPTMLARQLIDYRGEGSLSGVTSDLSSHLDPQATELEQKQAQIDQLETNLLNLRHQRQRLEGFSKIDIEENQEAYSEDLRDIQDLDGQIDSTVARLETVKADLRHNQDHPSNSSVGQSRYMDTAIDFGDSDGPTKTPDLAETVRSMPTIVAASEVTTVLHQAGIPSSGLSAAHLRAPGASPAPSLGHSSGPFSQGRTLSGDDPEVARKLSS